MTIVNKNLSRRNFVRYSGLTAATLTVGFSLPASAKDSPIIIRGEDADSMGISLNAFVSIDTTGK